MRADQIVDTLPEGYRWATPEETERWTFHAHNMVQVKVGGTDDEPWTDLAIKE